jgi:hypothetical protein
MNFSSLKNESAGQKSRNGLHYKGWAEVGQGDKLSFPCFFGETPVDPGYFGKYAGKILQNRYSAH